MPASPNAGGRRTQPAPLAAPHADEVFSATQDSFESLAKRILSYQRASNPVYARFSDTGLYLPIAAFKHGPVCTFDPTEADRVFLSSGTGQGQRAEHYVRHLSWYDRSLEAGFRRCFGDGPFSIFAHLPEYDPDSSLVYMASRMISTFGSSDSAFMKQDPGPVRRAADSDSAPIILLGAAFGLMDLIESQTIRLPADAVVVETGGMKTHRRAMGRTELHLALAEGFGLPRARIWSEYGMCELLSQCYATGTETYHAPPWMRVSVRNPEMPQEELPEGIPGVLAVLDLANAYSASAILTEDRAIRRGEGFEVLGRMSAADLRGCNFLMEDR